MAWGWGNGGGWGELEATHRTIEQVFGTAYKTKKSFLQLKVTLHMMIISLTLEPE